MLIVALLPAAPFADSAGGDGFVAPYVDTVREDVELILDLADVGPGDYLIDLGSGDGRFVIAAARRGAHAHGVELDPELVARGRANARAAGVGDRTAFLHGDIFEADVSQATVVTLYLFPEANIALRPKLLAELAPGTRLVSNSFHMGEWTPDDRAQGRTSGGALLWIIPARAEGSWTLALAAGEPTLTLTIDQRFQEIEASLDDMVVDAAALTGDRITIVARNDARRVALHGLLSGDTMTGTARIEDAEGERVLPWRAQRRRSGE
jgi:SAM-dependent methyltransferase